MSTVAPERQNAEPTPLPGPRRARWLVPLAVAAAVATVASTPLWWGGADKHESQDVTFQPATQSPGTGYRAVLTAPGWKVESTEEDSWRSRGTRPPATRTTWSTGSTSATRTRPTRATRSRCSGRRATCGLTTSRTTP